MVQFKTSTFIAEFSTKHKLSEEVSEFVRQFYLPLANKIAVHQKGALKTYYVGINGCQGSGKSTLADFLNSYLSQIKGLSVVSISIDDFYLSHQEREQLSRAFHPLLITRGVPGTHDVEALQQCLKQLSKNGFTSPVSVRRFDKSTDNPFSQTQWTQVLQAADIILLEGWFCGVSSQSQQDLEEPVNHLESEEDRNGDWRTFVNQQLVRYQPVFQQMDFWIMLHAPGFDVVAQWRTEQENKLRESLQLQGSNDTMLMDSGQIKRFVSHYQRLTEHGFKTFPDKADLVLKLNSKRQVYAVEGSSKGLYKPANLAIFTDLDGTLLDHFGYSYQPAIESLRRCLRLGFPVIPTTSKTFAEVSALMSQIGIDGPFICENGAAIYMPETWLSRQQISLPKDRFESHEGCLVKSFSQPRKHWLTVLDNEMDKFANLFINFANMTVQQVATETGLTLEQASLAMQRHYGEPIKWLGNETEKVAFLEAMSKQGIKLVEGGRFIHLCGDVDKSAAMNWLLTLIKDNFSGHWNSVALGDSPNDSEMLTAADIAVQILSPTHSFIELTSHNQLVRSSLPGPRGWQECMSFILDSLNDLTGD